MKRYKLKRAARSCADDKLADWIFRLEQQEIEVGKKPITDRSAVVLYQEIRNRLVILRAESIARKHEKDMRKEDLK